MISDICDCLWSVVEENFSKAGFEKPSYDSSVLNFIMENENPRKLDITNLLYISKEFYGNALFMSMLYRLCSENWDSIWYGKNEIALKQKLTRTVATSAEAQRRSVCLENDPFGIEVAKNNNLSIPFI